MAGVSACAGLWVSRRHAHVSSVCCSSFASASCPPAGHLPATLGTAPDALDGGMYSSTVPLEAVLTVSAMCGADTGRSAPEPQSIHERTLPRSVGGGVGGDGLGGVGVGFALGGLPSRHPPAALSNITRPPPSWCCAHCCDGGTGLCWHGSSDANTVAPAPEFSLVMHWFESLLVMWPATTMWRTLF